MNNSYAFIHTYMYTFKLIIRRTRVLLKSDDYVRSI